MGRLWGKHRLLPHPDLPHPAIDLGVKATLVGSDVAKLEYVVIGDVHAVVVPPPVIPERADELWRSTCFEAFVRLDDGSYLEYNVAPSGHWAIYRFEGYREGMQPAPLPAPDAHVHRDTRRFALTVWLDLSPVFTRIVSVGLSAVIEARDGAKSYWALAHPPDKPDFHHDACFALELPAARRS